MRTQKTLFYSFTVLGVGLIAVGLSDHRRGILQKTSGALSPQSKLTEGPTRDPRSTSTPIPTGKVPPIAPAGPTYVRPEEKISLQAMTDLIVSFAQPKRDLHQLIKQLNDTNQRPSLNIEHSQVSGDLTIVHTENPPPGTIYFHAQFFSTPGTKDSMQHMSFQFKPDPQAMNDAISAVQGSIRGLGTPTLQTDNFVQWNLPGGTYVIWVKRLNQEDVENDPFNPYMPEYIGSIRVAVEQNADTD
jgi:hypothetical protein